MTSFVSGSVYLGLKFINHLGFIKNIKVNDFILIFETKCYFQFWIILQKIM